MCSVPEEVVGDQPKIDPIDLLDLPLEIWHYLFNEKFLSLEELRTLSGVCAQLYYTAHQITTFSKPISNPFSHDTKMIEPIKKVCVKAWGNVAFIKYVPTPEIIKPDFHYIFHTWSDCPNVYFHLFSTRFANFENIIDQFGKRIHYYHCPSKAIPKVIDIPYFSFSGVLFRPLELTRRVKIVRISFSDIINLRSLSNLRELTINISPNIDLSTLSSAEGRGRVEKGGIQKISILDCNITSLEGVQGIREVVIHGRNRVTDFNPISKTPILSLVSTNIENLDFIKSVEELDISESLNLVDVYCLQEVPSLRKVTAWRTKWIDGFLELIEQGVEVCR